MAPMNRMKNCIGILATALNSRLSRLSAMERPGQIALHLRLVASEIGEEQEGAAEQAAPDVEAVVPIEMRGDGVQPARRARQVHRVAEVTPARAAARSR